MSIGTVGLRESEEIGADEICDTAYIIEKRRREALLLHLGRLVMRTSIITSL